MRMFMVSWRQFLAAATLAAVLSPVGGSPGPAVAAEDPPPKVEREQRKEERKPDAPAAREGRPRAEGDARDRRGGDQPRERREGDQPRERREGGQPRERREGDQPRERREGDARGRREGEAREGDPRLRELMAKRRQLEEKAADIRRKLEGLKPGQEAEARELKAALEQIGAHLRELTPQRDPGPRPEQLRARLQEIKLAIQRAREAGRADEAERLERQGRELMETAERMMRRRPGEPGRGPEEGDRQRRLQHLRVAIENLRAAGLHEPAESLTRQLEQGLRDRPDGNRPPEGRPRGDGPPPEMERALHELREQMQDLRRQMEEMRHHLRELSAKR